MAPASVTAAATATVIATRGKPGRSRSSTGHALPSAVPGSGVAPAGDRASAEDGGSPAAAPPQRALLHPAEWNDHAVAHRRAPTGGTTRPGRPGRPSSPAAAVGRCAETGCPAPRSRLQHGPMSDPVAPRRHRGRSPEPVRTALFGPGRRATTVGLVLLTLVTAFEAMGVGTAMPAVIADLGAVSAYGWPFSAFLAASVFGTVLGGRWCDSAGPAGRPPPDAPAVRGRAGRRGHRGHPGPAPGRAGAAGGERGSPVRRRVRRHRRGLSRTGPARGVRAVLGRLDPAVADRAAGRGAGHGAVLLALGVPRARPVRRGRAGAGRAGRAPAGAVRRVRSGAGGASSSPPPGRRSG